MRLRLVLPAVLFLVAACSSSGSPAPRGTPGDTITIRGTNMENTLKPGDLGDHRNQSVDSRYHCGVTPGLSDQTTACNPVTSTVPASSVVGYRRD